MSLLINLFIGVLLVVVSSPANGLCLKKYFCGTAKIIEKNIRITETCELKVEINKKKFVAEATPELCDLKTTEIENAIVYNVVLHCPDRLGPSGAGALREKYKIERQKDGGDSRCTNKSDSRGLLDSFKKEKVQSEP